MDTRECISTCVGILAVLIFLLNVQSCILQDERNDIDEIDANTNAIAEYIKSGCTREWVQGGGMQWVCSGGSGE